MFFSLIFLRPNLLLSPSLSISSSTKTWVAIAEGIPMGCQVLTKGDDGNDPLIFFFIFDLNSHGRRSTLAKGVELGELPFWRSKLLPFVEVSFAKDQRSQQRGAYGILKFDTESIW